MRRLFAFVFVIILAQGASSATIVESRPQDSLAPCSSKLSFSSLELKVPEIESKLRIPSKAVFKAMKEMVGQRFEILDEQGRLVSFEVTFNHRHLYSDIYYDVVEEGMLLFEMDSLLRNRSRWDKGPKDKDYKFRYTNFQAKNGSSSHKTDLELGVFAREEIRGKKFDCREKFEKKKGKLLMPGTKDAAVQYARQLIGEAGPLVPVLVAKQKRFFMKIEKIGPPDPQIPQMYFSLDKVEFEGLVGACAVSEDRVAELEIVDDLTQDSNANASAKLSILNRVTLYLQNRFHVSPVEGDKYVTGVRATILRPGFESSGPAR